MGKYGATGQTTDGNVTGRMRIACWIPKATKTHSDHVIPIPFPLQQWLHKCLSKLRYSALLVLFLLPTPTHAQIYECIIIPRTCSIFEHPYPIIPFSITDQVSHPYMVGQLSSRTRHRVLAVAALDKSVSMV